MRRSERVTLGFLVGSALGFALAFVGVLITPGQWCDEVGQPTGQNLLVVGGIVGLIGGIAAFATLATSARRSYRLWLCLSGVVAAYVALFVLNSHLAAGGSSCP